MTEENQNYAVAQAQPRTTSPTIFTEMQGFQDAQRIAKSLCSSSMVPEAYQTGKHGDQAIANAMVAMEMAQRTGSSVMPVMQNMTVIHGKPSWSSQFIIAALNSCGRFSPLRFVVESRGKKKIKGPVTEYHGREKRTVMKEVEVEDVSCMAWAYDRETGEKLEGPAVTIEMAVLEGWYLKSGSKWKTMPDLMLRYRAAAFFGRLYAPEMLMGMQTQDEVIDVAEPKDITPRGATTTAGDANDAVDDINEVIRKKTEAKKSEKTTAKKRGRPKKSAAEKEDPESGQVIDGEAVPADDDFDTDDI